MQREQDVEPSTMHTTQMVVWWWSWLCGWCGWEHNTTQLLHTSSLRWWAVYL